MSTKRNTKKFRKSLKRKNSTQNLKNQFKNNTNVIVFDMDLLDKKIEDYSRNISTEYEILGDKLNLIRRFPSMGEVKIIITKTNKGYSYEDIGMFRRNFSDLDRMIWEFELPNSLKEIISNLPIVDESRENFRTDTMEKILELTNEPMIDFLKEEGIIS